MIACYKPLPHSVTGLCSGTRDMKWLHITQTLSKIHRSTISPYLSAEICHVLCQLSKLFRDRKIPQFAKKYFNINGPEVKAP